MYNVVYLPTAKRQLADAVLYIAEELLSPDAAGNLLDEVDDRIRTLSEYPYRHPLYPSPYAIKHEIRFLPVKNYLVFYIILEEQKTVEIWRFFHQRQEVKF